jgi:hypothetical protein
MFIIFRQDIFLVRRATLELSLRHSLFEKKTEYDALMKAQKSKEREFKNYKRIELQLRSAQDSLTNIKFVLEKVLLRVCLFGKDWFKFSTCLSLAFCFLERTATG